MRRHFFWLGLLLIVFISPSWASAGTGDLGAIIESFVTRHFPDATSHVWIVNGTQWEGDEMIVDVRTVVVEKQLPVPIENRYLLLIMEGKLAAAQRIPLEDDAGCQSEDA